METFVRDAQEQEREGPSSALSSLFFAFVLTSSKSETTKNLGFLLQRSALETIIVR